MVETLDARLFHALYGGVHGRWGWLMLALSLVGEGWTALLLVPLLWNLRTRVFASFLAGTVVVQAIGVWALKLVFGRVRPWIALGLPPPFGAPHDGSCPSGHAAGSFCVAAFVLVALPVAWPDPRARPVGVAGLGLAALIALSRVYLGAHFPSDVLAGAVLGASFGVGFGRAYVRRVRASAPEPRAEPGEAALGVERAPKRG